MIRTTVRDIEKGGSRGRGRGMDREKRRRGKQRKEGGRVRDHCKQLIRITDYRVLGFYSLLRRIHN